MNPPRRGTPAKLASSAIALLLFSVGLRAQTASVQPPHKLLICEGAYDTCLQPNASFKTVWEFNGPDGTANTPNGSSGSRLTVEKFDGKTIVIRRFDRAGATAGLSGLYTGTIDGNRITGTVKWSWLNHGGFPPTGNWAAMIPADDTTDQPATSEIAAWNGIPPMLLICEGNGPCDGAWTIQGTEGSATWFRQNPVRAKLTIVRADPDDLLIRRTDLSDGNSAVYTGKRHNGQLSGTVIWSSPNNPGGASGTWSASVPITTCRAEANLSPAEAMKIGQNGLMFGRKDQALTCYLMAAQSGDALAQTVVGMLYYQGKEIPRDDKEALIWLRKAADQGVYIAQKTVSDMFMLGQGTPRDAELSRFYADKAAEQKHDWERAEDRADAERHARMSMVTGFVMGAVFGAVFF